MLEYKTNFITWYHNEFKQSPLFNAMAHTKEDSMWHREESVGIHTDMVVSQYLTNTGDWDKDTVIGAIACVFHDAGKPSVKKEVESKARGKHFRFTGHELTSARLMEDYITTHWLHMVTLFGLEPVDIYKIGWIVEYHKPWDIKKPQKLMRLSHTLQALKIFDVFCDVLDADTAGRIADDAEEQNSRAAVWLSALIVDANANPYDPEPIDTNKPVLMVLIGASGSGKTTLVNTLDGFDVMSMDLQRLHWYDFEDYANAYQLSIHDPKFLKKSNAAFMDMIAIGNNIVVDNTNISNKRRRFYVDEARKKGYTIQAVLFPVAVSAVAYRQTDRLDKHVPVSATIGQYMNLQMPAYYEFDVVDISVDNLPS